jgi:hypothetical protein
VAGEVPVLLLRAADRFAVFVRGMFADEHVVCRPRIAVELLAISRMPGFTFRTTGQLRRSKKLISIRGLNKDHNHDLKGLFKGVATMASVRPGPFQDFYQALLAKGMKPTMARLTLARKIAAITLTLWKIKEKASTRKN